MNWEMVKVGDLFSIVGGGTPDRSNSKFWNGNIPWVTVKDFVSKRIERTQESISELGVKSSATNIIKKGSIIVPTRMALGKISICTIDVAINQDIKALLIKNHALIDTSYFCYFYESQADNIEKQGKGATVKGITLDVLREIQIPLPPLATQKRIAEILDAADALRRKDQQLLKKYDELAQAIFIDMFGDPVKNEKGWEVKKLGDELKSIRYGTGSPPQYSEDGIPFLRATNVKAGRIERKGMVFLTEKEAQKISKCIVNEGDLIIVRSGANTGDCAYISAEYANCLAGYDLIVEMDKVKSRFYNYFLNSIWGKAIIEKLSRRAGQPHLNSEQVSNIECIAPDYFQLEKFKLEIDSLENLRKLSIETNNVSINLFQSLIQKAFTGELVQ